MDTAQVMGSEPTKAFATRLPTSEAERFEAVVDEADVTRSALVRRAIRFYIAENPDHLSPLFPEDFTSRMIADLEK